MLSLETSTDGTHFVARPGVNGFALTGTTQGGFRPVSVPLDREQGQPSVSLGFRLQDLAGTSPPGDGVAVDDLSVTCLGDRYDGRQYAYAEGTSFAAPMTS